MSLLPHPQVTEVILHLSKLMATLCVTSGSDGVAGSVTVPLRWNPAETPRGEEAEVHARNAQPARVHSSTLGLWCNNMDGTNRGGGGAAIIPLEKSKNIQRFSSDKHWNAQSESQLQMVDKTNTVDSVTWRGFKGEKVKLLFLFWAIKTHWKRLMSSLLPPGFTFDGLAATRRNTKREEPPRPPSTLRRGWGGQRVLVRPSRNYATANKKKKKSWDDTKVGMKRRRDEQKKGK